MGGGPSKETTDLQNEVKLMREEARRAKEENKRIQKENRERESREAQERVEREKEENRRLREELKREETRRREEGERKKEEEIWKREEAKRIKDAENKIKEMAKKIEEEANKREKEARKREEEGKRIDEARKREENNRRDEDRKRMDDQVKRLEEEIKKREEGVRRREEEARQMEKEARHREEQARKREEEIREREHEANKREEEMRKKEETKRIEEEKKRMNELAKTLEEEAKKRIEKEIWLRKEAERNLAEGIPPIKYPTGEDIQAVREKLQYRKSNLHFAITGVSGSGKSSLINAFRGLSNSKKNPDAARVGTNETTSEIGRYGDSTLPWMFWYDVPGAGTIKVPDWQYFNDQGLYIFDAIIIAIDTRFTKTDAGLLLSCKRFGIPTFVVRSKANQHIFNTMGDDYDEDESDDDGEESTARRFMVARDKYVADTRREFGSVLKDVNLPPQKVYIVSKEALCSLVKGSRAPLDIIDEVELVKDIFHTAKGIRGQNHT